MHSGRTNWYGRLATLEKTFLYGRCGDESARRIRSPFTEAINDMRSELVFAAERSVCNRYALCRLVSIATRTFHRPNTRVEETTDAVLRHIGNASGGAVDLDCTEMHVKPLLLPSDPVKFRAY